MEKGVSLVFLGVATASFSYLTYSFWNNTSRTMRRNIEQLRWIKEHPPRDCTEKEMILVESELERQLDYERIRYLGLWFTYPPRVHWIDIPMDDEFVKKFY